MYVDKVIIILQFILLI